MKISWALCLTLSNVITLSQRNFHFLCPGAWQIRWHWSRTFCPSPSRCGYATTPSLTMMCIYVRLYVAWVLRGLLNLLTINLHISVCELWSHCVLGKRSECWQIGIISFGLCGPTWLDMGGCEDLDSIKNTCGPCMEKPISNPKVCSQLCRSYMFMNE